MIRRFMLAAVFLSGGLLMGAGAAHAQAVNCAPYVSDTNLYLACIGGATITGPGTAMPGDTITVNLSGWAPGSTVTITIDCAGTQVNIGSVNIGAGATGSGNVTIPASCPTGPTTVTGTGTNMGDQATSANFPIVLGTQTSTTPTTVPVTQIPVTGAETGRLVTIGAALVVIGSAALYGSLRARQAQL